MGYFIRVNSSCLVGSKKEDISSFPFDFDYFCRPSTIGTHLSHNNIIFAEILFDKKINCNKRKQNRLNQLNNKIQRRKEIEKKHTEHFTKCVKYTLLLIALVLSADAVSHVLIPFVVWYHRLSPPVD